MRLRRPHSARNIQTRALLDTFFVCAIATILIIRLQLWATNYPKLGGGKLHIAHLLWGGLGMLVAIVVLLTFLSQAKRHTAAILGGIGFAFPRARLEVSLDPAGLRGQRDADPVGGQLPPASRSRVHARA
jgi:hypothetical protein